MALAGAAFFMMRDKSLEDKLAWQAQKPSITDTKGLMHKFATGHPTQDNVNKYYDDIDGDTYDEFNEKINFTDPYMMTNAILRP